jgi:hypothetical protein
MDNVMKDIQEMKSVNWEKCAQDRNKWKSIVVQAKIHRGAAPGMKEWLKHFERASCDGTHTFYSTCEENSRGQNS